MCFDALSKKQPWGHPMTMKKLVIAAALVTGLDISTVHAAHLFVAAGGQDTGFCVLDAPCASIGFAASVASSPGDEIACLGNGEFSGGTIMKSVTVDCNGTTASIGALTINGSAITVVLRNFTIFDTSIGVTVTNGNLVMENIHIRSIITSALQVLPITPSKIAVKNCLFDDNAGGVLLKPASGGSVNATLDHVMITGNTGGGIKTDTTNGAVTVNITDSVVSNNSGNGINAVGNTGGQNIVSIKNSVIAKNAVAGVQANGADAGVMIAMTLLDQNTSGALSVVGGSSILTYGNNQVVGAQGSNFTGTAPLK
jgi:hypothetical protein